MHHVLDALFVSFLNAACVVVVVKLNAAGYYNTDNTIWTVVMKNLGMLVPITDNDLPLMAGTSKIVSFQNLLF